MSRSVIITVSGEVQGVCFRAATKKQANKLNITGYAKNLSNGSVEINATGENQAIEALISWSYKGSVFSKVDQVEICHLQETQTRDIKNFEIR